MNKYGMFWVVVAAPTGSCYWETFLKKRQYSTFKYLIDDSLSIHCRWLDFSMVSSNTYQMHWHTFVVFFWHIFNEHLFRSKRMKKYIEFKIRSYRQMCVLYNPNALSSEPVLHALALQWREKNIYIISSSSKWQLRGVYWWFSYRVRCGAMAALLHWTLLCASLCLCSAMLLWLGWGAAQQQGNYHNRAGSPAAAAAAARKPPVVGIPQNQCFATSVHRQ